MEVKPPGRSLRHRSYQHPHELCCPLASSCPGASWLFSTMLCCLYRYQLTDPGTPQPPRLQPYLRIGHPPLHITEPQSSIGLCSSVTLGRSRGGTGQLPPFHLSDEGMKPRFGTLRCPSLALLPGHPHPCMKGLSCSVECGQL